MSKKLIDHIIEMKEMIARVEEKSMSTNSKIEDHIEWCAKRDAKVDELDQDMNQAKGSIKALKWGIGLLVAVVGIAVKALT